MVATKPLDTLRSPSQSRLITIGVLWLLGVMAVCLHVSTRGHVHLTGHQGVGWVALLMLGRLGSDQRWAGLTTASGAATIAAIPMVGFNDPFMWLMYLCAGLILDVGHGVGGRWRHSLWFWVLLGALAHLSKPFTRLLISGLTGWPYSSLLWGVGYPAAMHFLFGAIGAMLGVLIVGGLSRGLETVTWYWLGLLGIAMVVFSFLFFLF